MVVTKQVKTTLPVAGGAHWEGRLNGLSESYLRSCSPPGTETFQCDSVGCFSLSITSLNALATLFEVYFNILLPTHTHKHKHRCDGIALPLLHLRMRGN